MADGEMIDRLVVEFDAKTDKILAKLDGLNRATHKHAAEMEKAFAGIDFGKSLDKVFDSSRLAVLDAGAERLRVFGSALEPLGALGLAAGAGLAALGVGLELAEKTGEWATELGHLSEKLGVSVEQVQQFDYVWTQSGIGIDKGREAIEKLNESLGKAQAGLLRPQTAKAFEALGFGKDAGEVQQNLLKYQDVGEFIDSLPERFDRAGSAAERMAIANRIGGESLVPILHDGPGGWRELTKAVEGYGVMSEAQVAHAAHLNEELQTAKLRVAEASHEIGAEFLPTLLALQTALLNAIGNLKNFWVALAGSDNPQTRINSDTDKIARFSMALSQAKSGAMKFPNDRARSAFVDEMKQRLEALEKDARSTYEKSADEKKNLEKPKPKALLDPMPKKHTPGATFDELNKADTDKADEATKKLDEARAALTEDVMAHAALEKRVIADELAKQKQDLDAEQKKIADDKKLTAAQRKHLDGELQIARIADEQAAAARTQLVDRNAREKIASQATEQGNAGRQGQVDLLRAQESLAKTTEQRKILALKILALEEEIYDATARQKIAALRENGDDAGATLAQTELDSRTATLPLRQQEVAQQHQSPGQAYVQKLQTETGAGIGDTFEADAVKAMESFNSQLTTAIVNAKNFGQVFQSLGRQIETDLVNMALEKYLTLPLAQALGLSSGGGGLFSAFGGGGGGVGGVFGSLVKQSGSYSAADLAGFFATGTDFAPGGLSMVGEQGPELVNIPKGAQVIPNNLLGSMGVAPGMNVSAPSLSFDLRGAVVTEDLLSQMNDLASGAESRATQNGAALGAQMARTLVPQDMSRRASLQIR